MCIDGLAARMDRGELTAAALVETCLSRIAERNETLHAVSTLFAEAARSRAADLDAERRAGQVRGPLHGIPIVVKELIDIEGHPTAFGSRAYAREPARRNAPLIDRLEAAGAIILATAHMVEFAIGSWGTNHVRGTPRNPADPEVHRAPGGSSSGSAVAVAARLAPAAIGSDTGGSIRIPAGLCGVVGFKPSYGLIPIEGVAPLGPSFDTVGPLATCVPDARLLFAVLSGVAAPPEPVATGQLRIAVVPDEALAPVRPFVLAAFHAFLRRLRAAGASIEIIHLPRTFREFQELNGAIVAFEAYAHLRAIVEDPETPLDPHVRGRVMAGKEISADQHAGLLAECRALADGFARDFADFDALALPTTPMPAPPLAEVDESTIPMSRFTRIANCLNLCAISLPRPVVAGALPVGVQLCAPAGRDWPLLDLAGAVVCPGPITPCFPV